MAPFNSIRIFRCAAAALALLSVSAVAAERAVPMGVAPPPMVPRAPARTEEPPTQPEPATEEPAPQSTLPNWTDDFGFAVGIGYSHLSKENIKTASVRGSGDAAVVRIDESNNGVIGVWLELHNWLGTTHGGTRGFGPFVAIQAASTGGSGDAIGAYALGFMYGSKRGLTKSTTKTQYRSFNYYDDSTGKFKTDSRGAPVTKTVPTEQVQESSPSPSWNIGIGVASITVQTLGDGLTAGSALPTGVTEVYYKKKRMYVPLIMSSFTF